MTTIANRIARLMTGAHARLYRATGGKVAGRMGGQQLGLLTTTGRRTGRQHTTPLTCFPRGSDVVVVASNAGSDRHPSWYLNLQARPTVRLQVRDEVREMTARTASAEEKAALWPQIVADAKNFGGYERRTRRNIPLVVLSPLPDAGRPAVR